MTVQLSLSVVYHSSAQLPFVNYLPFFLMMLIGFDSNVEKRKSALLVFGTFMTAMTCFYFLPACLGALAVYAAGRWKRESTHGIFEICRDIWRQFCPVLWGVMLSMFYMLPVFCAMKAGRGDKVGFTFQQLFLPDISFEKYLYSPYGLGLTAIGAVILCTSLLNGRCIERRLAILLAGIIAIPFFYGF
ncbi:MAG: hypothetical protein QM793_02910 [Muricomes sp.]